MIADGLHFSAATARTIATTKFILSGLTLRLPLVLMNGVVVYDPISEKFIKVHTLPPENTEAVIRVLKEHGVSGLMYEIKDSVQRTYYETLEHEPIREFVEERITRYKKKFIHAESFSDIPPGEIVYFTLLDTLERLQPVYEALSALPGINIVMYNNNYNEAYWLLEVHSGKAGKKSAVDYLRKTLGYEVVVGFGDNLNDLPMFEACDIKVAVENAKPEVKAAADYICGRNEDDGVVRWMLFERI
jgi:hypothetical protein